MGIGSALGSLQQSQGAPQQMGGKGGFGGNPYAARNPSNVPQQMGGKGGMPAIQTQDIRPDTGMPSQGGVGGGTPQMVKPGGPGSTGTQSTDPNAPNYLTPMPSVPSTMGDDFIPRRPTFMGAPNPFGGKGGGFGGSFSNPYAQSQPSNYTNQFFSQFGGGQYPAQQQSPDEAWNQYSRNMQYGSGTEMNQARQQFMQNYQRQPMGGFGGGLGGLAALLQGGYGGGFGGGYMYNEGGEVK